MNIPYLAKQRTYKKLGHRSDDRGDRDRFPKTGFHLHLWDKNVIKGNEFVKNLNIHGPYVAFCKLKKGEEISGICILRTASRSNNNTSSPCVRGPSQNVALGSFTSCSGRRRKVQTCVILMQSCCFAHKGWIHLQHTRKAVAFACRNLRPRPHVLGYF